MARDLSQAVRSLRAKIVSLASQRDEAREEIMRLRSETTKLRAELDETRKELDEARMEVDFLTVSHRLADTPGNLVSARRRIRRLIAKIDRCVTLLKDDADIS